MRESRPRFGVLGFGRFGQMVVRELEPHGEVVVHDPHETAAFPVRNVSLEQAATARSVILAVPIRRLEETLRTLVPHLQAGTLVVDVASVKTYPLSWMESILPSDVDYVGTHPLFGPDSAKTGLSGHRMVIVPGRIGPVRLDRMHRFLHRIGLRTVTTTTEVHDRAMARTQALTHWLGRALGEFGAAQESIDTHGYRLLLQVSTWASRDQRQLFEDMHRFNPYSAEVRARFRAALESLDGDLTSPSQDST